MKNPSASTGFDRFELHESLVRAVRDAGFDDPRPIQLSTIPAGLAGRDVLGLAQTGTGKTAAFALPVLHRIVSTRRRGPRALVVAPTRELASQIAEEFGSLGRHAGTTSALVFGGVSQRSQVAALRRHPDVVVGCPGRLLDLLQQRHLDLSRIEVLVLDEADHMFDMGFLPSLRKLIAAVPARRQNLLFSATMPAPIRRLADEVLRDPHVAELGRSQPASTIDHALFSVHETRKRPLLERMLADGGDETAIVFTRTKHRAKRLADQLRKSGHRATALQGNMSQGQRERAMGGFRDGTFDVLVATDIAARGIDVAAVGHVINFDVPTTSEAYTHRIGRTGRAALEGRASTFVTDDDHAWVRATEKMIGAAIERRRVDGFDASGPRGETPKTGKSPKQGASSRSSRPRRARSKGSRGAGKRSGSAAKPAARKRPARASRPQRLRP